MIYGATGVSCQGTISTCELSSFAGEKETDEILERFEKYREQENRPKRISLS
jgi:hypothetical protein